ncbi:reticulon-3 isoform X1 [Nematolebias whitei]|uniref:reticulon-3 isoform X1 n=1 Tax=Nematolebias whitei TaxID=451745 RepID=UPI00189ADE8C|nr:reticulon-3 isoform X1 [Nematolebias whitei]
MDSVTQSAQISSSQGFADGQNFAAKESKLSDSFLSSSPVSLIQSPQDKAVVPGSEKPHEGVATSLHFSPQPGLFSASTHGSEEVSVAGQEDSPVKISPVSERIKALEALAAKTKEPDFRGNGGFTPLKDRFHEKSPFEATKSPFEKVIPSLDKLGDSADQESPVEILVDMRQVNEFEETEQWIKAHVPPVPDFDAEDLMKGDVASQSKVSDADVPAAFAVVPDAFMDRPVEAENLTDAAQKPGVKQEIGTSFLPTAYMWDQDESSVAAPSSLYSVIQSPPAPPTGFGTASSPLSPLAFPDANQNVSHEEVASLSGDLKQQETSEADSSGESEDTVIEDDVVPASVSLTSVDCPILSNAPTVPSSTALDHSATKRESPPPKSERKLMQVPTINVIETDEPNYSEEEMEMEPEAEEDEDFEVVEDPNREALKTSEPENNLTQLPKTRPLETEFMEGYSPPSSPVDSDAEYSPQHKIPKSSSETEHQPPPSKSEVLPSPADLMDSAASIFQAQSQTAKPQSASDQVKVEPSPTAVRDEEVDFPDNDDEWSDEVPDILVQPTKTDLSSYPQSSMNEEKHAAPKEVFVKPTPLPLSSFMQDEIYDRQSFDYDFDATSALDLSEDKQLSNAKERFLSDPVQNEVPKDMFDEDRTISLNYKERRTSLDEDVQNPYSCFESETINRISEPEFLEETSSNVADYLKSGNIHEEPKICPNAPDTTSPVSEPADSFVEFMKECLKSRQDEEGDVCQGVPPKKELSTTSSHTSPSMVMDLEQEHHTINALKELVCSQDEEVVNLRSEVSNQNQTNPSLTCVQPASAPSPPCSRSSRVCDNTHSKEVEAIDEWVAEAYHLAEHVLTAILTHLSVKDLIHWRDPKKSGVVFGLSMLMLLSLAAFSVISVVSYLLLALLCVTITFRIYKSVVQAVQKSNEGHPFKALIEKDVSVPPETFRKHVDSSLTYINRALKQMSRLFLVEDLVDSLKLAVVMWLLTYVGAVFNGITILILADILLFAVPPVYEKNKTQIDHYIDLVRTQVNTTLAKLQEKLPGAVKRAKAE